MQNHCQPWIARLFSDARDNAIKRGIRFDLSLTDVSELVAESGMRCSITGVRFNFGWQNGWSRRPWVPSIDRINSRAGYEIGNVRIVSFFANNVMREWGDEPLLTALHHMRPPPQTGRPQQLVLRLA